MKSPLVCFGTVFLCSISPILAQNLLVNGGFESGITTGSSIQSTNIGGWSTTSPDGKMEVWKSGYSNLSNGSVYAANGPSGTLADGGSYFGEVNATQAGAFYQTVTLGDEGNVDYFFLHRGRAGADTLRFSIIYLGSDNLFGTPDDQVKISRDVTTDNINSPGEYNGWQTVSGDNVFTSVAGGQYRFSYEAVSTGSGSNSVGNFIDNAAFGLNLVLVPEPSSAVLCGVAVGFLALRRRRNG